MAGSSRKPKRRPSPGTARPAPSSAGDNAPKPPSGQVGRRPSRPGFLALVGVMWIVVGVIELFALDATWRIVPAIVFVGIGLFFLRGAATTVVRRDDRDPTA